MKSFCRQTVGLEVLMKVAARADRWKRKNLGQEQRIYCHHNVELRQNFVKNEAQWLNQKQETGYWFGWKIFTEGSVSGKKSKSG